MAGLFVRAAFVFIAFSSIGLLYGAATAQETPSSGPVPAERPESPPDRQPETPPRHAPIPEDKPDENPAGKMPADPGEKPEPRPDANGSTPLRDGDKADGPAADTPARDASKPAPDAGTRPSAAPSRPAVTSTCRERLRALGAEFREQKPQDAAAECRVEDPLLLTRLGRDIDIEPDALLDCDTAEALVRFASTMSDIAEQELGAPIRSVSQASAFVCRPRHNGGKLSEHALGKALDIARLDLANGEGVDVAVTRNPAQSRFLSRLRTVACGPFKTVLGPGSDADHATHFHFDLAERRNGSTFCQ